MSAETIPTNAAEAAAGLRALADFIDANPQFADAVTRLPLSMSAYAVAERDEDPSETFARLTRQLGGTRIKRSTDSLVYVSRKFGPIALEVFTSREAVCERVVVGTETVEVPDPDAPMVTVERDVIEWQCSPVLDSEGQA